MSQFAGLPQNAVQTWHCVEYIAEFITFLKAVLDVPLLSVVLLIALLQF